jgi:hypothetical protein
MASEVVKIYAWDQNDDALVGVLVRVFDDTGTTFIAQNTTALVGSDAVAEFTLDGDDPPNSYTIRMSKTGVGFDVALGDQYKTPQLIEVWSPAASSPTGTNDFDVKGETFAMPVAIDARLCRASGFFKDATGRPLPGLDISLINDFKPAIVDGYGVLGSKVQIRTDDDGYVEVDLYRGGEYRAMVQSLQAAEEDTTGAIVFDRELVVPDQASVSIIDLLFPVVDEVTWSPVSLAVGESVDLIPVVIGSDARTLEGTACEDVLYEMADTDVATVSALADRLVITGVSSGSTELMATRRDQTVVFIPDAGITGSPLAITVT